MGDVTPVLRHSTDVPVEEYELLKAEVEQLREDFRTLYAYTKNIEGEGPIRYVEALDICRRNGRVDG